MSSSLHSLAELMEDEEQDWDSLTSRASRNLSDQRAMLLSDDEDGALETVDHRTLPRSSRKKYDHARAKECVMNDYLGPQPLFDDKQFELQFRVTRSRFQRFLEDFGNSEIPFYNVKGNYSALECRLLLPLKTRAYGVPPHCFTDYFQMSNQFARDACTEFDLALKQLYQ